MSNVSVNTIIKIKDKKGNTVTLSKDEAIEVYDSLKSLLTAGNDSFWTPYYPYLYGSGNGTITLTGDNIKSGTVTAGLLQVEEGEE